MALSLVSVNKQEFDAAEPEGYVYGYAQYGTKKNPVYVSLGNEVDYIRNKNDDPCTSYRLFFNSTVYYAETDDDLDNEIYSEILEDQGVKILC